MGKAGASELDGPALVEDNLFLPIRQKLQYLPAFIL
jgi:hypothetical protein